MTGSDERARDAVDHDLPAWAASPCRTASEPTAGSPPSARSAGDGRTGDQVRFDAVPRAAACMTVVADPARLEAQQHHREAAIADTYAMVRPTINRLAVSIIEGALHG